jgi:hypothetical protein
MDGSAYMNISARRLYPNQFISLSNLSKKVSRHVEIESDTLSVFPVGTMFSLLGGPCRLHAAVSSASVHSRVDDLQLRDHLQTIKLHKSQLESTILTAQGTRAASPLIRFPSNGLKLCLKHCSQSRNGHSVPRRPSLPSLDCGC